MHPLMAKQKIELYVRLGPNAWFHNFLIGKDVCIVCLQGTTVTASIYEICTGHFHNQNHQIKEKMMK